MIKLFQTKNAAKRGFFHIILQDRETYLHPQCKVLGYYMNEVDTRENANVQTFDGSQKLCPSCVSSAYLDGLITVIPVKKATIAEDVEIVEFPYPPCVLCGGENDQAEICYECSKNYDPYVDLEASGGYMVQGGRNRE